jgi:hypothetical protein
MFLEKRDLIYVKFSLTFQLALTSPKDTLLSSTRELVIYQIYSFSGIIPMAQEEFNTANQLWYQVGDWHDSSCCILC